MTDQTPPQMQHVDPASLRNLSNRVAFMKSFLSFTEADGRSIESSKALIAPLLPAILEAVYTTLLSFDITAKAFVPRQPGHTGDVPKNVTELALDHPQILRRKDFLKQYLVRLVSNNDWGDDGKLWEYMDRVGIMHTGEPGFAHRKNRPELRVEYLHMGMLLGFVEDVVAKTVLEAEELDAAKKVDVVRAFNKLLWIQNDLFARHYVVDHDTGSAPRGVQLPQVSANAI
ncbi:MAG: hypothetical protein M1812_004497 [Candelaria pacifica]|nr:MAG: hypothetical protein M1812_004497 [Candelaria pacifica]